MPANIGRYLAMMPPFNPEAGAPGYPGGWRKATPEEEEESRRHPVGAKLPVPSTVLTLPPELEMPVAAKVTPPAASSSLPPGVGEAPTLPGPPKEGIMQRLMRNISDPRVQMFLFAAGQQLAQPRGWGQTGVGAASNALSAGYGALSRANEVQRMRDEAARKERREQEAHEAETGLKKAQTVGAVATATKTIEEAKNVGPKFDWEKSVKAAELEISKGNLAETIASHRREAMEAERTYNLNQEKWITESDRQAHQDELNELKLKAETAKLQAEATKVRMDVARGGDQDTVRQLADLKNRAYQAYKSTTFGDPATVEAGAQRYAESIYRLGGGTASSTEPSAEVTAIDPKTKKRIALREGKWVPIP